MVSSVESNRNNRPFVEQHDASFADASQQFFSRLIGNVAAASEVRFFHDVFNLEQRMVTSPSLQFAWYKSMYLVCQGSHTGCQNTHPENVASPPPPTLCLMVPFLATSWVGLKVRKRRVALFEDKPNSGCHHPRLTTHHVRAPPPPRE